MKKTFTQPLRLAVYTAIITSLMASDAAAQCSQTGTISPSSAINDDGSGAFGFSSPASAIFSDNSYATATAVLTLLSGQTDYLKVKGFALSVPAGSTICGIQMKMEKKASGISILASVSDYRIRLMKNGAILGSNRAKSSSWSSKEAVFTYGGPTDLWGTSWTPAEVNNGNFGIAISAEINGLLSVLPSAHINDVSMTVYYSHFTLPVKLVSFNGQLNTNRDVKLSWKTSGDDENTNFIVQRSTDGTSWNDLTTIAADPSGNITDYNYTDRANTITKRYYRLAIRNSSGAVTYSEVVSVMEKSDIRLNLYPNPATDMVTVESQSHISAIKCFNATGVVQQVPIQRISDNSSRINVAALPTGLYYIQVDGEMLKLLKK
jgi:hypothetical protein